jgi:[ribosomal protein S18]-alanine N-acetyltransferase
MNLATTVASGSQVNIEPATWRDLNPLRELERVCFPLDAWPLWDLIGVLTLPNVVRLKAVVDGKFTGFVAGDVRPSEKLAWIATIGVLPEFQGRGIGTALLLGAENRVGVPRMRLCVRVTNLTAIHLYEHKGYKNISTWPNYYGNGEDALVMEKLLG